MALASHALLPLIQSAITPVILITGLGSLLLTMTNRLGRIVDRTRILAGQARVASGDDRTQVEIQLRILFGRAKLVRMAVSLTSLSMFVSGLLVAAIFLSVLNGLEAGPLLLVLFVAAIEFHEVGRGRVGAAFTGAFRGRDRAAFGGVGLFPEGHKPGAARAWFGSAARVARALSGRGEFGVKKAGPNWPAGKTGS